MNAMIDGKTAVGAGRLGARGLAAAMAIGLAWASASFASSPDDGSAGPAVDRSAGSSVLRTMLTPEAERAIERGVRYLVEAQGEGGGWGGEYPGASTGAALTALLAAGHLPGEDAEGRAMRRGLAWLRARGEANAGYLGTGNKGMYEHALATLALAELAGESDEGRIVGVLRAAVKVIVDAQNDAGGWRYKPDSGDADVSVTAMQVVALASASEAGLAVPTEVMAKARRYLGACFDEEVGGFRYQPNAKEPALARTAAGTAAMMFLAGPDDPRVRAGLAFIEERGSRAPGTDYFFYGLYYAAQCMYRAGDERHARWYPAMRDALVDSQADDGSWSGSQGGAALSTAMAVVMLGAEYRYLPIYQR